jgi:hypothetical protein
MDSTAAVSGNPDTPAPVFGDVIDDRMPKPVANAVVGEAVPVKAAQAFPRAELEVAFTILMNG